MSRERAAGSVALVAFVAGFVPYLAVSTLQLLHLPTGVALTSLLAFGGYGLTLAWAFSRTDRLGLARPVPASIAFAVLVGLVNVPVATLLNAVGSLFASPETVEQGRRMLRLIASSEGLDRVLLLGGAALCAPLGEELFFRGFLQPLAIRATGRVAGIVAVGLAFAAIHLQPSATPALLELGVLFGVLRARSGSLWPAVAAHAVQNGVSLAVLFLADDPLASLDARPEWPWLLGLGLPAAAVLGFLLWRAPVPANELPADDAALELKPTRLAAGMLGLTCLAVAAAGGLVLLKR